MFAPATVLVIVQPRLNQMMILARRSCWRHCVILKHEQGKLRKQQSKPMLIRSTLSHYFSNRHHSSLLINSGSDCCSWRTSATSLRTKTNLFPVFFQMAYLGFQTGADKLRRLERGGVASEGVKLEIVLLLLQWGWVLSALVSSLVGPWGVFFHLFKFLLCYGCQRAMCPSCW